MPARRWRHSIPMADILHNEDLSLEEARDLTVARIKAADLPDPDGDLAEILEELADADSESLIEYEWDRFYDWADDHDVWVDPFEGALTESLDSAIHEEAKN